MSCAAQPLISCVFIFNRSRPTVLTLAFFVTTGFYALQCIQLCEFLSTCFHSCFAFFGSRCLAIATATSSKGFVSEVLDRPKHHRNLLFGFFFYLLLVAADPRLALVLPSQDVSMLFVDWAEADSSDCFFVQPILSTLVGCICRLDIIGCIASGCDWWSWQLERSTHGEDGQGSLDLCDEMLLLHIASLPFWQRTWKCTQ